MLSPRALVLRAPGTNCDHETAHAFERAGAIARQWYHLGKIRTLA
ncbi:MAG: phosphoribosylformylglycinamidine synthase, partial [Alphaproteobacteria bacterium]|nr:phosphoribosylformylglycinamidine synthase [Alphaproteobacteria bacterium]